MKVVFVDWGRKETEVKVIRLEGVGLIQDARFERTHKVAGDYERQVYEVAVIIDRIQPDRIILDIGGLGAGLGRTLRYMLTEMGIGEKKPEEMPVFQFK